MLFKRHNNVITLNSKRKAVALKMFGSTINAYQIAIERQNLICESLRIECHLRLNVV